MEAAVLPNFWLFDGAAKALRADDTAAEKRCQGAPWPPLGIQGKGAPGESFLGMAVGWPGRHFLDSHWAAVIPQNTRVELSGCFPALSILRNSGFLTSRRGSCWTGNTLHPHRILSIVSWIYMVGRLGNGAHVGLKQEWGCGEGGGGTASVIEAETVMQDSFKTRAFPGGSQKALGALGCHGDGTLPALACQREEGGV